MTTLSIHEGSQIVPCKNLTHKKQVLVGDPLFIPPDKQTKQIHGKCNKCHNSVLTDVQQ